MSDKRKVKKSKRVVNDDNTPASWGDVYNIASLVDGIVSNVASITLYVKENKELKPKLDEAMLAHISTIADNISSAKERLIAVMADLPGKETDVVKEEDFANYLLKYSEIIDIKDAVMSTSFEPYVEMTLGAMDIVDGLSGKKTEMTTDQPASVEGTDQ